jgi:hypothetical protein
MIPIDYDISIRNIFCHFYIENIANAADFADAIWKLGIKCNFHNINVLIKKPLKAQKGA